MVKVRRAFALVLVLAVLSPATAAEKGKTNKGARTAVTIAPLAPGQNMAPLGTFGVMELTESDCRLDGGTVVKPGDDRCGSLGAVYCRKPNGEAACINEQ
jgi:hypothetical protein